MREFLRQVAQHYYTDGDLHRLCFVFPNKRSIVFFKKYLGEEVSKAGIPARAPRLITISELFYSLTRRKTTDRIQLLVELYNCYKELNPKAESLDDFIYWGGVLLSDFGDVDKYLADPEALFKNISDLRAMQDDFSYLDEKQKEAIRHFLSLFEDEGTFKTRFRAIWDILLPLYKSFNASLREKGLSYEGMVFRELAEDTTPIVDRVAERFKGCEKFVFVGLNALNKCERRLMSRMRNAGIAEFCWDFCSKEIRDPQNKSAYFLAELVTEYPQAFKIEHDNSQRPHVHIVSTPSSVGQAKLLPEILKRFSDSPDIETAIVLPDEGLLIPTLNSLPESIKEVNVTMGYPMQGSEFLALMNDIASLQVNLRERENGVFFYHRQVWGIFSNGLFNRIIDDAEREAVTQIRRQARYFIPTADLAVGDITKLIFRKADDIAAYQKDLILGISPKLKGSIEQEFAMTWYQTLSRLEDLQLGIKPATWYRLLLQLAAEQTVAFKGEPLQGMQIMGPLETRALDFENIVILSANEGIFPRRNVAASFIPAEIRKGFDLPTYEHQDAIWAYYFYRLIQRAKDVWMVYDSRTEIARSGEESRYIKQLEMIYGFDTERFSLKTGGERKDAISDIPKTAEDVAAMHAEDFHLSATALQNYLVCPAKFYYSSIKKLGSPEEVAESLDAGMLGSVLHNTIRALYSVYKGLSPKGKELFDPIPKISREHIESLLKDNSKIQDWVDHYIRLQMGLDDISGKNLVYREVVISYVRQILQSDLDQLKKAGKDFFYCLGLEEFKHKTIGGFDFVGFIDRIDSFDGKTVRIVDYKTGKVSDEDIRTPEGQEDAILDALFGEDNANRPKIALQLYLYDVFMADDQRVKGLDIVNCIYQTAKLFIDEPLQERLNPDFCSKMSVRLDTVLQELDTPGGVWKRKGDEKSCSWCDFKTLCGK